MYSLPQSYNQTSKCKRCICPNAYVHISLSNVDLTESQDITLSLGDMSIKSVTGRILTSESIDDYNSFEHSDVVVPKDFKGAKIQKNGLQVKLPAKSIVVLEVK